MVTLLTRVFIPENKSLQVPFTLLRQSVISRLSLWLQGWCSGPEAQAGEARIPPSGRQAASRVPANCKTGWEEVSPGCGETNNVFYEDFVCRSRAQNWRQMLVQFVFDCTNPSSVSLLHFSVPGKPEKISENVEVITVQSMTRIFSKVWL